MDPTQGAVEYEESREAGDKFPYRQVAKDFRVDRTTLSRRHKGSTRSNAAQEEAQQIITLECSEKV